MQHNITFAWFWPHFVAYHLVALKQILLHHHVRTGNRKGGARKPRGKRSAQELCNCSVTGVDDDDLTSLCDFCDQPGAGRSTPWQHWSLYAWYHLYCMVNICRWGILTNRQPCLCVCANNRRVVHVHHIWLAQPINEPPFLALYTYNYRVILLPAVVLVKSCR